jgi:hypothetical protein
MSVLYDGKGRQVEELRGSRGSTKG